MRIVLIGGSYLPEVNGGVINVQSRLELLSEWGHEVLVVIPDYELLSKNGGKYHMYKNHIGEVLPNVRVIPFPSATAMMEVTLLAEPFSFDAVVDEILAFKPDIIDVESPERLWIGFRQCIWRVNRCITDRDVPTVAVHHANYVDMVEGLKAKIPYALLALPLVVLKGLYRHVYVNSFDLVLIHSDAARARLIEFGVKDIKQSPFLGIDTKRFTPIVKPATEPKDAIAALNQKGAVRFVYLGRKSDEKDLPVLMEGFDKAEKMSKTPMSILLVGGGEPILMERIAKWAEGRKNVGLVDMVPHSDAPGYFALADVFVQPSPIETAGLTVLEAMACGKPVIGADQGGVGETITKDTGLTFKSGDAGDCARQLVTLAEDSGLRAAMGKSAIELASNHSVAEGTRRMVDMWEELVEEKKGKPARPYSTTAADSVFLGSVLLVGLLAFYLIDVTSILHLLLICVTSAAIFFVLLPSWTKTRRCPCDSPWTHAAMALQIGAIHGVAKGIFWVLGALKLRRKMSYEK